MNIPTQLYISPSKYRQLVYFHDVLGAAGRGGVAAVLAVPGLTPEVQPPPHALLLQHPAAGGRPALRQHQHQPHR